MRNIRLSKDDTLHCIVYGEMFFGEGTAEINRVVGVMEVIPGCVDDIIESIEKMGYEWTVLQENTDTKYSLWHMEDLNEGDIYYYLLYRPWVIEGGN